MPENVKLQRNPELNALALKLISKHSHMLAGEIIDDLTNTLTPSPFHHTSPLSEEKIASYKLQADYHVLMGRKVGSDAGKLVYHLECANFYRALQIGFSTEKNDKNTNKGERWK